MDAPIMHSRVDGEGEKPSYMKKMKVKAKKLKDNVSAYRHQGQEQQVVHNAPADEHDDVDDVDNEEAPVEQPRKVEEEDVQVPKANLDQLKGLEEDDHAPKTNSQADTPSDSDAKIPDQIKSGDEEIEVTPVLHSFNEMNINAENGQHLDNGANDKRSTKNHDQLSPDSPSNDGRSYMSSATSAIANSAISAKNAVASRLGYGTTNSADHVTNVETPRKTIQPDQNAEHAIKSPNSTYTEKLSSATYAIAGGAISAKNAVASKLGHGSKDQVHENKDVDNTSERNGRDISTNELINEGEKGKGVTVKDYIVEKLRPGEEDKALSEVLSDKLKILKPGVKEETGEAGIPSGIGKVTESDEVKQRLVENAEGNDNFAVNKIEE